MILISPMVLICGINCVLYRTIHFFRDDSFGSFEVRIITGCGTSVTKILDT